MPDPVKMAFEHQIIRLALSDILPTRHVPDSTKQTARYKRIVSFIAEVGVVEPLIVARRGKDGGPFILVDGHLRHAALLDLGTSDVLCLITNDDEGFTYNKRVSRLATIQEHYMIVKAIERGFPRRNSPGRSMSTSGGSRPSGHCSTGSVPKSPSC